MSADLVRFLKARLDDDEAYARNAFGDHNDAKPNWHEPSSGLLDVGDGDVIVTNDSQVSRFIVRFDPARVLAEVAAKRRIVATFVEVDTHPNRLVYAFLQQQWVALRAVMVGLALPYADHPDCRDEWRP